jgi:AcrR family transcriptional regulator
MAADAAPGWWREYPPLDFDPVLRAALEEIMAIGYHGATVRGIAARCGLSVSGVYHYYPSKQQLLYTILDRTMTDLLGRARAARAEGRDPVERFSLLVRHLALFHTHRRELGFVGASEMRSLVPANRRRIAEMRMAQQRMVDQEAEGAVREGRFRQDHPREAARAVVTMCTALANWWRPGGPLGPEPVAEQYVGFALGLMRYEG